MNLREQLYVCAIAKTGSLTAAAKILNTSQPNLSLFLSNLERSLNIKLFDRIGKQFRLTYAGELYVAKAQKMIRLKEEFDAEISSIVENISGRLRMGFQYFRSSRRWYPHFRKNIRMWSSALWRIPYRGLNPCFRTTR